MVRKQGHMQLPLTRQEAYTSSAQALKVIGAVIKSEDQNSGRIEAKRGMSFRSLGENLEVEVNAADRAVYVRITSSSAWPTTLFDWGRNQENVDRFLDWLRR